MDPKQVLINSGLLSQGSKKLNFRRSLPMYWGPMAKHWNIVGVLVQIFFIGLQYFPDP